MNRIDLTRLLNRMLRGIQDLCQWMLERRWKALPVALLAAVAIPFLLKSHSANQLERDRQAAWEFADKAFRQRRFADAVLIYEKLVAQLESGDTAGRPQLPLARAMADVTRDSDALEHAWSDRSQSWRTDFGQLQKTHAASLSDEALRTARTINPTEKNSLPAGTDYSLTDRWTNVLGWVKAKGDDLAKGLERAKSPDPDALARLDELTAFLDATAPNEALKKVAARAHRQIEVSADTAHFQQVSDLAVQSLTEADLRRAADVWTTLRRKHSVPPEGPSGAIDGLLLPDSLWEAHAARVREALKKSIGADRPEDAALIGRMDRTPLPLLAKSEYGALAARTAARASTADKATSVFVAVEDRCYALAARNGEVQWVCRVGFDAPGPPQAVSAGGSLRYVVPWSANGQDAVTVVDENLDVSWTWQLPAGHALAGAPTVSGQSMYVTLEPGEIWRLHLQTGAAEGRLTFPGPLAGPLWIREDGRSGVVVGRNQSVYFLHLGARLELADIVQPAVDEIAVSSRAVCIPPFAIVCHNNLSGNCTLVALFDDPSDNAGYREVQRLQIAGRVWQPPAISGTDFLFVSDLGTEAVYGLRVDNLKAPMFLRFQRPAPQLNAPRLPQYVAHKSGSFLAALGPMVLHYDLKPLEARVQRAPEVRWNAAAPHPETVAMQPLQPTETGLVVASRSPADSFVRVKSFDYATGHVRWQTDLGSPLADWHVFAPRDDGSRLVLGRTASNQFFRLTVRGTAWTAVPLGAVQANESVGWSPDLYSVVWTANDVSAGGPHVYRATLEGSLFSRQAIPAAAASPLCVRNAAIRPVSSEGGLAAERPGPWVVWIDAQQRVRCVAPGDSESFVQFAQLDGEAPVTSWLRPRWLDDSHLLAEHPDGYAAVLEVREDAGLVFLRPTAERLIPGAVWRSPTLDGDRLWVSGRDGFCRRIALDDLKVRQRVALPGHPTTAPVVLSRVFVGLDSGEVARLAADDSAAPEAVFRVSADPIEYLERGPGAETLYALDRSGRIYRVDGSTGTSTLLAELPAPALPPIVFDDAMFVGTVEGSLHLVPLPDVESSGGNP